MAPRPKKAKIEEKDGSNGIEKKESSTVMVLRSKSKKDNNPEVSNKYLNRLMYPYNSEERERLNRKNLDKISARLNEFRFWEQLPTEIKCMIIKEVDFITRYSLLSCSKSMHKIAKTVPFRIQFCDADGSLSFPTCRYEEFAFCTWPSGLGSDQVSVHFRRYEKDVFIDKCWKNANRFIETKKQYSLSEYGSDSFSVVEEMLKLADYRVDEFNCRLKNAFGFGKSDVEVLDKLQVQKKLFVSTADENVLERLLDTAKSPLDKLEIEFLCYGEPIIMKHEAIKNAKELIVSGISFDESSVLDLKCVDIAFLECRKITESVMCISDTDAVINTYLKRWVDGGGPKNFSQAYFAGKRTDQVFNDLECIEWDDEFRRENKTLCNWIDGKYRGDKKCYYIETKDKNNGATLLRTDYRFEIWVTGKRQTSG